jgi:hypothetical protein
MALVLKVVRDEDPIHPRDEYRDSNIGHMVCWHRQYKLGDERPTIDPIDFMNAFNEAQPEGIILPLYLYDHGGITIRVSDFADVDPTRFDSGQVGWILAKPDMLKELGVPEGKTLREVAIEALKAEVEQYDAFLQGNVWGFVVTDECVCGECGSTKKTPVDSCWGFYDFEDMIGNIEGAFTREQIKAAWDARE